MVFAYPRCRNIVVDDKSKPYRDAVVRYLDLIATTDVGRALYNFIGKTSKTVGLTWTPGEDWAEDTGAQPLPASASDVDRVVAAAVKIQADRHIGMEAAVHAAFDEDPILRARRVGSFAKGSPVMHPVTIAVLELLGLRSTIMVPNGETGTGEGIDVKLDFHPAAFEQIMKTTGRVPVGLGPGEVLYHELVHALRMMTGVQLRDNVPEHWDMYSFEEFCSILAANMYRSARGFKTMRYDHHVTAEAAPWLGTTPLPPELANSKRYYQEFKPEIVKWFNTQRGFCVALAGSRAPFNPMAVAAADLKIAVARP